MKDFNADKNWSIMGNSPLPDLDAEDMNKIIVEIKTEAELATIFAVVDNKARQIAYEIYDFEEGTKEYTLAEKKIDLWFSFSDTLRQKIFAILRAEGVKIPSRKQIVVLEPFMKRNGFKDGNGWWIKI